MLRSARTATVLGPATHQGVASVRTGAIVGRRRLRSVRPVLSAAVPLLITRGVVAAEDAPLWAALAAAVRGT